MHVNAFPVYLWFPLFKLRNFLKVLFNIMQQIHIIVYFLLFSSTLYISATKVHVELSGFFRTSISIYLPREEEASRNNLVQEEVINHAIKLRVRKFYTGITLCSTEEENISTVIRCIWDISFIYHFLYSRQNCIRYLYISQKIPYTFSKQCICLYIFQIY